MKRFVTKPSKRFIEAVKILRELDEGVGAGEGGNATRAYAAAVYQRNEEIWAKNHGLKKSSGHACIRRLLGKRCDGFHRPDGISCHPPGADHSSLWNKNGKPAVYVMQPYVLSWDNLQKLVDLCRECGLEVIISTFPGWHFPGAVVMSYG